MDTHPGPHPTDEILAAYGLGKLDDATAGFVGEHLEGCPACRGRVAEVSSDSFLGRLREARGRGGSPAPAVAAAAGGAGRDGERRVPAPSVGGALPVGLPEHPDHLILRELGRGRTGVIYLAQNRLMGRHEVLKVISGRQANRGGALDRILAEIRDAARLHHPNIATLYSARRSGDDLVLAMEYVEGFDLTRVVKAKGPLPIANACHYVHQIAAGLQHAHENGMVHQNIKPANLILAPMGGKAVVKILDFGLTRAGLSLGTPEFMAPEQTTDPGRVDIRTDIYSLGCTLYFLLTGSPPFEGANLYDILQAHQSMDAVPLNLARPDVPMPLAIIAATMIAKDPGRRFQTLGDVSQALAPFLKKEKPAPQASAPESPRAGAASPFELSQGTGGDVDPPPVSRPSPANRAAAAPAAIATAPAPTGPVAGLSIEIPQDDDLSREVQALREAARFRAWLWPAAAGSLVLVGLGVTLGMSLGARGNRPADVAQAAPTAKPPNADPPPASPPPPLAQAEIPPVQAPPVVKPTPEPARKPAPPRPSRQPADVQPAPDARIALARTNDRSKRPVTLDRSAPPRPETETASEPEPPSRGLVAEPVPERKPAVAERKENPDANLTPEQILAKRGLKRSQAFYIIATESDFAAAWKGLVPHYNLMDAARVELMQAMQVAAYAQDLNDQLINLQAYIRELNLLMGRANRDQRMVLQAQLQEANLNLTAVQASLAQVRTRLVGPAKMQQLQDIFMKRRGEFLEKSGALRPIMDKLNGEYAALKQDTALMNALNTLKERKKVNVSLGPSAAHKLLVRKLRDAEEEVSLNPESYRRKKKAPKLKQSPKDKD